VANIKSQIKRNRQNEAARLRNKSVRSALKTSAKKVRTGTLEDSTDVGDALREVNRSLDRAASKRVIHKRTAARRKSRLSRSVARSRET
jgi:small subunit ribosomal protein S20